MAHQNQYLCVEAGLTVVAGSPGVVAEKEKQSRAVLITLVVVESDSDAGGSYLPPFLCFLLINQ